MPPRRAKAADLIACARGGGSCARSTCGGGRTSAPSSRRCRARSTSPSSPRRRSKFAEEKIDWLASTLADDPPGALGRRLYRSSCVERYGLYIKDLRVFGRPPGRAILVEDLPCVGGWQPDQVVPIAAWRGDPSDDALTTLLPHLLALAKLRDRPPRPRARRRAAAPRTALGDAHRGCARLAAEQDAPPAVGPPTPPPAHLAAAAASSADDPWGAGDPRRRMCVDGAGDGGGGASDGAAAGGRRGRLPPCTCTGNMHALAPRLRAPRRRPGAAAQARWTVLDGGWAAVVSAPPATHSTPTATPGETRGSRRRSTAGFARTRDPTAVGGIPPPAKERAAADDRAAKAAPAGDRRPHRRRDERSVCVEA